MLSCRRRLNIIILNKGSKDGIKIGMVVLEKNYLVGQVIEVNYTTSRAILISDLNISKAELDIRKLLFNEAYQLK